MSYIPTEEVAIKDGPNLDAFSRLRVSNPITLLDGKAEYGRDPLVWDESTAGSGSVTALTNESSVELNVTTASGDKVVRQTHRPIPYQPAKGQLVLATGVMIGEGGSGQANCRRRIGLFSDKNGLFFELDGTDFYVVRRTYASGSAVDTRVAQSAWNLDTLDGSGDEDNPSGIELDLSKAQIFIVTAQWLGVGRVQFGLDIDGVIVYVHSMYHANLLDEVYAQSIVCPLRYEIENTGAIASAASMKTICSTVISEGQYSNIRTHNFSVDSGVTPVTVTGALTPVLAVRPKLTHNGVENRQEVKILRFEVYSSSNPINLQLYWRPTSITGGTWLNVNTESCMEYNVTMTGWTGGHSIRGGYLRIAGGGGGKGGAVSEGAGRNIILVVGQGAAAGDALIIAARVIAGPNSDCYAALDWEELR